MSSSSKVSIYEQKYKEIELLGRGTQGSAMLVECRADNKRYVSKKVVLTNLSEKDQNNAILELKLLREMKHPNIVKFIEGYKEKNKIIIIMEYCECGDLSKLVKDKAAKGQQIEESLILQWLIQICSALTFIHSKRVIHRDIKSSNIFITKSNCVKIGDFGVSKQLDGSLDKANTMVGTPYYLSPEVCSNKPYTYKSDMWSLGCVIYELCSLKHPFQSNSLMTLVMKIASEKTPKIPPNYSLMIDGFIRSFLKKLPEKRPSAQDILNNQHVQKLMKEFVQSKENFVHDIQNIKQIMQSKGATQGEITLMEKQLQERLQKQQDKVKAQIQAQSQVMKNESASKQQKSQLNSAGQSQIKQQHTNGSSVVQNISENKTTMMSITQREREIQERLSNIQSEVMQSYQRLNTPQSSAKKNQNKSNMQDSGVTVRSEMMQTSSSKKGKQKQDINENNYSDGENTIQSIAISKFEHSNTKNSTKSKIYTSQRSKKDQLGSTVKSFIAEDDNEDIKTSGNIMSSSIQQESSNIFYNESQRSDANSQFLTSSEGERESDQELDCQSQQQQNRDPNEGEDEEDDDDDQSERYSPSMALELIQNESILLSKFVLDKDATLESQDASIGNKIASKLMLNKNESGIEQYSTDNPQIYGSKPNPVFANDDFSETNLSLNVSLTQDSVFLKSKLGLTGLSGKSNNLMNQIGFMKQDNSRTLISEYNKTSNIQTQGEATIGQSLRGKEDKQLNIEKQDKKLNVKDSKQAEEESEEYYEDDFEEYEDDFEEYKEDGEDENDNKGIQNKNRASQKFDCHFQFESDEEKYEDDYDQLDSILDMYKGQLHNTNSQMSESVYKFDLTEIIEVENSALYSANASDNFEL